MPKKIHNTEVTDQNLRDDEFVKLVYELLEKFGRVKVTNLGVFHLKDYPARTVRNPKTNGTMRIGPRVMIKFRPSSVLTREFN